MVRITAYGHATEKQVSVKRSSADIESTVKWLRSCGYQCVSIAFV